MALRATNGAESNAGVKCLENSEIFVGIRAGEKHRGAVNQRVLEIDVVWNWLPETNPVT